MHLSLATIADKTSGQLLGQDRALTGASIDSRKLSPGDLFIAIRGERFDGHDFAGDALHNGAVALLLEKPSALPVPQIIVADTRIALGQLAAAWRHSLSLKLVGVTGSNGKTTVKEMIAAILSVNDNVLYTQGNLNNDIGVPLTLLRLTPEHRYAVIEMGANHPGEIAYTSCLVDADVVVITNAGSAHLEGFGDIQGVAKTKGEIIETLADRGVAVLKRDDDFFDYWRELAGKCRSVSFGDEGQVSAKNITFQVSSQGFLTQFELVIGKQLIAVELALAGEHNVMNALAAAAVCLQLGIDLPQIKSGLATMRPVKGRLQIKHSTQGCLIIDDSYNANPNSLQAGLSVLQQCPGEPWLVLGAFGELGEHSADLHRDMGRLCRKFNIRRLLATGVDAQYCVETFGEQGQYFADQEQLIAALQGQLQGNEAVLVKGSRAQKMENVVAALIENTEE